MRLNKSIILEIVYGKEHWEILRTLRNRALRIAEVLEKAHNDPIIYGSLARGDISKNSDIDIFVPNPSSSFLIEMILERSKLHVERRYIIQATPNHAPKAYIDLKDQACVSFPLVKLHSTEIEFYDFGGKASPSMILKKLRIPGVPMLRK